jgi:hypothetical protein
MTWNHRVVRKVYPSGVVMFGIHEVLYKDYLPNLVTENPIDLSGESMEELRETLDWIMKALSQPVLEYSDFEEGGKYYTGDDDPPS